MPLIHNLGQVGSRPTSRWEMEREKERKKNVGIWRISGASIHHIKLGKIIKKKKAEIQHAGAFQLFELAGRGALQTHPSTDKLCSRAKHGHLSRAQGSLPRSQDAPFCSAASGWQ